MKQQKTILKAQSAAAAIDIKESFARYDDEKDDESFQGNHKIPRKWLCLSPSPRIQFFSNSSLETFQDVEYEFL